MRNKKNTTEKLGSEVKGIIVESIHEALSDPEYGKELQDWVEERLNKYKDVKDFSEFVSVKNLN